jgi:hypothetical protein
MHACLHGIWVKKKSRLPIIKREQPQSGSGRKGNGPPSGRRRPGELVLLFARLLPTALASQCFLHTLLLAGLQVKRVSLHFLDDVFLLHLAFETAKRILEGFSLLKSNLCQTDYTPKLVQKDRIVIARLQGQVKRNVKNISNTLKWMLHHACLHPTRNSDAKRAGSDAAHTHSWPS